MEKSKKSDKTVFVSLLSGLFSSSLAKLITHPFDTIKAKIQVDTSTKNGKGIIDVMRATYKLEGRMGLYKGLPVSVFGSMPAGALYFSAYEFSKKRLLLLKNFSQSEFLTYFLSGMFAEIVSCIIFVPVDVIKERRQVQSNLQTYKYKNDVDALFTILKQEKLKGLYKAYGATVMSFGPMSAFYFMFYEFFKGYFVRNDAKTYIQRVKKEELEKLREMKLDISFPASLVCSALAGAVSSLITNPLDLVKLRMQVQRGNEAYNASTAVYRNLLQGLVLISQTEGIRGLFKGSIARIVYHTPTAALSMSFVEIVKPHFRKMLDDDIK